MVTGILVSRSSSPLGELTPLENLSRPVRLYDCADLRYDSELVMRALLDVPTNRKCHRSHSGPKNRLIVLHQDVVSQRTYRDTLQ